MAAIAVAAAALIWSSSYAVTKQVLGEVGPLATGAIRFTLAAGMLSAVVRLRRGTAGVRPDVRQRRAMYLSGLLGITVYFALENIGVAMSAASDASLIVATYPLMTMLLERAVLRTPVSAHRVFGVLVAGAGAVLVVRNGAEAGGSTRWAGDLLLLAAGLAWAGYNVLGKSERLRTDALTLTYHQTLAGAAGFLAASLVEISHWSIPGPADSMLLVYLAAACSVGAFLLYNYGLQRMSSSAAVNILNLVPVGGVIGAVLINGESITLMQVLGGCAIIVGASIGMIERTAASPAPAIADRNSASDDIPCKPTRITEMPSIERRTHTMPSDSTAGKVAIIVDSALPPGLAANTTAVLALTIGHRVESLIGDPLKDSDGSLHAGITTTPVPILTATADDIKDIRTRAETETCDVLMVDFTDCAQQSKTYDDYASLLAAGTGETIKYLGVGLHGPAKRINKLTGSLRLLR